MDIEPIKDGAASGRSKTSRDGEKLEEQHEKGKAAGDEQGPLTDYEETIHNPRHNNDLESLKAPRNGLEVETPNMQDFLASQLEVMERLKAEEDQAIESKDAKSTALLGKGNSSHGLLEDRSRVNEHIGPVQFNMGGIQVDAEDMLKRLGDREREETPDREGQGPTTPDGKSQNEALANFFAGLMKRGGSNSPRQAPS